MELKDFTFPTVSIVDLAFPTFDTIPELLEEAKKRDLTKGKKKFNELFYKGGIWKFRSDVKGSWKEEALLYARSLMGSFAPKHEHKELVCAMILQECLIIE